MHRLPLATGGELLKFLLTFRSDPLLLENLHFLGEVRVERTEEFLVQDALG